jgi:hypothetical protein
MEGDVILVETVALLAETIEFSEENSIVFEGALHRVRNEQLMEVSLPRQLGDETRFAPEIQAAFQKYCQEIADPVLYQSKTLTIPVKLKRLILYDRNLISQIVRFAVLPKSLKLKETENVEHRVTLRRYHFAHLDSADVRIPRAFGEICGDKPLRYVKMSYLLSLGFDGLAASGQIDQELANALHPDFDGLGNDEHLPDDDEAWLDSASAPAQSLEDVGAEMAERVASFISEVSGFDSVDAQGPINFDPDVFCDKLEHFLDSDSAEEDEEEDADEVLEHLDAEDQQLFRAPDVSDLLMESLSAQPDDRGPAADLLKLFELGTA